MSIDWLDIATVVCAVLLTWLPGAAVLLLAGVRRLMAAAAAPAVTFGLVAVATLIVQALHVHWSIWWLAGITVLTGLVVWLVRNVVIGRRDDGPEPASPWSRRDVVVLFCVGAAAVIAAGAAFAVVSRGLSVIPQDYDHVFQANAIRYISVTGDPSPQGLINVNGYDSSAPFYYPSAWHALASLLLPVAGGDILRVYHAVTIIWFLALPLGVAVAARSMRIRVWGAAGAIGISTCLTGLPWEPMWRGLMPFIASIVPMLPIVVLSVEGLRRRRVSVGIVLAMGLFGLVSVHTSAAVTYLLLAMPALLWMIARAKGYRWSALGWLVGVAALIGVGLIPAAMALSQSLAGTAATWPLAQTLGDGVEHALTLTGAYRDVPLTNVGWFVVPGLILSVRSRYRWAWPLALSTVAAMVLHVLSMSVDTAWSDQLTQWWWSDPLRLGALVTIGAPVFVGVTIDQLWVLGQWMKRRANGKFGWVGYVPTSLAMVALLLVARTGLHNGMLFVENKYTDGPTVTPGEVAAYHYIAEQDPKGRVMNDPGDGSAWMYALYEVKPVFGHFAAASDSEYQGILYHHFDELGPNKQVDRAVRAEDIEYVVVGKGFVFPTTTRADGLEDLDARPDVFREVFSDPDATVYKVLYP